MLRKSLLFMVFLAMGIFAFSLPGANAALTGGMVSGVSTTSVPVDVYVNPGNTGDALIYGYYNARNALTFIKVVNTSETTGIAAKVRIREAKNSNEILDFFICLSSADQWTGWLVGDNTSTIPASLYWWDNDTPSYPDPNGGTVADNFTSVTGSYVAVPTHYSATGAADVVTADDTKEGYFEIIGVSAWADTSPGGTKIVDTSNDCGFVLGMAGVTATNATATAAAGALADVPNTLAGTAMVFANGGTYSYNATALADFRNAIVASPGLGTDDPPRLDQSTNKDSAAPSSSQTGMNEVNFALTKDTLYFFYDIQSAFTAATTGIVTFPTKRRTVEVITTVEATAENGAPAAGNTINGPFNDLACLATNGSFGKTPGTCVAETTTTVTKSTSGRCEIVTPIIYNDSEDKPTTTTGFSPAPTSASFYLCDEANLFVIGDTATSLVSSTVVQFNVSAPSGYDMGWVKIPLTGTGRLTSINNAGLAQIRTVYGLPAIAYELQGFVSGGLTSMLPAKYLTSFTNP